MDVPQTLLPSPILRVRIESMQICHELILVEEMDELSAMELYGVDQEDGVVDARDDWSA